VQIDAGEEEFAVPSLAGESGWTGEQDGLLLTAVGLCPSFGEINCDAVGRFAEHEGDECVRRWLLLCEAHTVEREQLYVEHRARVYAEAPQAPAAAHIGERLIEDWAEAGAAPPREQAEAARRRPRRLVRKPSPERQRAGMAVGGQRWTAAEDALLCAAVDEFEGWVNPWSHIADAVAGGTAQACGLRLGKLSVDGS
jgi:hypothetical protein